MYAQTSQQLDQMDADKGEDYSLLSSSPPDTVR